jgi:hypothetical protein
MLYNAQNLSEKADISRKLIISAHGHQRFPGLTGRLRKVVVGGGGGVFVSLSWKVVIFTRHFGRTISRNFVIITTQSNFRHHCHLRNTPSSGTINPYVTKFQNTASVMDKNRPEFHVLQIRLLILNKLACHWGVFLNDTFCRVPIRKMYQTLLHVQRFYLIEKKLAKNNKIHPIIFHVFKLNHSEISDTNILWHVKYTEIEPTITQWTSVNHFSIWCLCDRALLIQ